MSPRSWGTLVAEGRRLVQATPLDQWAIGDLALEAVPPGKTKAEKADAQLQLAKFADAIGWGMNPVKDAWYTAASYGKVERVDGVSFAKHAKLRAKPNRAKLLLGILDDDDAFDNQRQRAGVEKVEELLTDVDIRKHVARRARDRRAKWLKAMKAIEDEALVEARAREKDGKEAIQRLQLRGKAGEKFADAAMLVTQQIGQLAAIRSIAEHCPPQVVDHLTQRLEELQKEAARIQDAIAPPTRSPQPRQFIDVIDVDAHPGTERRPAELPRGTEGA
jgi:hypothetical protein